MENISSRGGGSLANDPQVTSPIPEERILARRLRIQKRNAAARKRLQSIEYGKEVSSEEEETILEQQVEKSTKELLTLTYDGRELISNVRVAADAHEVKRRVDQAAAKEARIKKLEEEANIAQEKFDKINSKWENIAVLNDPLDLHQETEMQREKCMDLIAQKDRLINELKAELKEGDIRFVKDQQKQAEDIALLVERIDNQITIMRRAYRNELVLIEQAIDIERKERMEVNNKRWETLYRQREEDEMNNLEQRFVALSEHNQLMQDILIHHQEKFRATKISLEKDIQVLQQQLEQVKAICLLNKEKMEYNYQVLKKRDEESLLIRSQQKRRINKLQDMVTTLRRKLVAMEKNTQAEVKRLTSEVIKLHRNIKDIRLKSEHFCVVNETKYFQLWKFNNDSAQKLLDKIFSIDRLLYEQHLGLTWEPVSSLVITKKDLPSYRAAVEKCDTNTKPGYSVITHTTGAVGEGLLRHILEAVADRSGFLVEDRLTVLLAPYTRSQNTLVRIENVFNALGVTKSEDMELLRQTMEPYIVCFTCQPLLGAVNPVSPPASPSLPELTEEEIKARVMKKLKDTLEEGEKIAHMKKDMTGSVVDKEGEERKMSAITDESEKTGFSLTPWRAFSLYEPPERSFLSIYPPASQSLQESPYTQEEVKVDRHDPTHVQSINPVFVLKALRDFVEKFQATKSPNIWKEKTEEKKSISRQLTYVDVERYWEQFRKSFPPDRVKVWDCLYMGLQRYHAMLQERHEINTEIKQLKMQNAEFRCLLQKYALPNNMKPMKGPHQKLPPICVKTPPAPTHTPAPARLILSFDKSSTQNR